MVTYNIHKGIGGVDRRYRLERIIETVGHYEPDVVFLQEVDDGVPRSRHDCQVERLGEALGLVHRAFQRNVHLKLGHYGNAILSRFPLRDVCHLDLTIPLKKRRQAIAAHLRVRHGGHVQKLLVINLHLGLAGYERRLQVQRLLKWDVIGRTHRNTGIIVAGDFNDVWGTLGTHLLEPAGFQPACGLIKTFPAVVPVRSLDRIFYRGNLAPDHAFASRLRIARQASDHLPLVAVFQFGKFEDKKTTQT